MGPVSVRRPRLATCRSTRPDQKLGVRILDERSDQRGRVQRHDLKHAVPLRTAEQISDLDIEIQVRRAGRRAPDIETGKVSVQTRVAQEAGARRRPQLPIQGEVEGVGVDQPDLTAALRLERRLDQGEGDTVDGEQAGLESAGELGPLDDGDGPIAVRREDLQALDEGGAQVKPQRQEKIRQDNGLLGVARAIVQDQIDIQRPDLGDRQDPADGAQGRPHKIEAADAQRERRQLDREIADGDAIDQTPFDPTDLKTVRDQLGDQIQKRAQTGLGCTQPEQDQQGDEGNAGKWTRIRNAKGALPPRGSQGERGCRAASGGFGIRVGWARVRRSMCIGRRTRALGVGQVGHRRPKSAKRTTAASVRRARRGGMTDRGGRSRRRPCPRRTRASLRSPGTAAKD